MVTGGASGGVGVSWSRGLRVRMRSAACCLGSGHICGSRGRGSRACLLSFLLPGLRPPPLRPPPSATHPLPSTTLRHSPSPLPLPRPSPSSTLAASVHSRRRPWPQNETAQRDVLALIQTYAGAAVPPVSVSEMVARIRATLEEAINLARMSATAGAVLPVRFGSSGFPFAVAAAAVVEGRECRCCRWLACTASYDYCSKVLAELAVFPLPHAFIP
jgi:hypothetical protein